MKVSFILIILPSPILITKVFNFTKTAPAGFLTFVHAAASHNILFHASLAYSSHCPVYTANSCSISRLFISKKSESETHGFSAALANWLRTTSLWVGRSHIWCFKTSPHTLPGTPSRSTLLVPVSMSAFLDYCLIPDINSQNVPRRIAFQNLCQSSHTALGATVEHDNPFFTTPQLKTQVPVQLFTSKLEHSIERDHASRQVQAQVKNCKREAPDFTQT